MPLTIAREPPFDLQIALAIATAFRGLLPPGGGIGVVRTDEVSAAELGPAEWMAVRTAVPQRRTEFAAGRRAARQALAGCGVAAGEIPARADRSPVWPPGMIGSITHAAGCAVAVAFHVGEVCAVGIDLEREAVITPALEPLVLVPAELDRVRPLSREERSRAATAVFSIKEAFYKCQAPLTGRWLDFHDVEVHPGPVPESYVVRELHARKRLENDDVAASCVRATRRHGYVLSAVSAVRTARGAGLSGERHDPGALRPVFSTPSIPP